MLAIGFVTALTGGRDPALESMAKLIDRPPGFVRWELYIDPE